MVLKNSYDGDTLMVTYGFLSWENGGMGNKIWEYKIRNNMDS